MDISSIGGTALSESIQNMYAVKCILMSRHTDVITGALLQDTAEISQEAMEKYLSEVENK